MLNILYCLIFFAVSVKITVLIGTRKKEDALYDKLDEQIDEEEVSGNSLSAHEKILLGRKRLPIYAYREEFLEAVRDNKIIVVVGETGSGNLQTLIK